jgi:hypothetical protein
MPQHRGRGNPFAQSLDDQQHLTSERSDQSLVLSGNNYTIAEDSKEEDVSFATPSNVFG